jgi:hypothetical protein
MIEHVVKNCPQLTGGTGTARWTEGPSHRSIVLICMLAGLLVYAGLQWQSPWINKDGVRYLEMAELISRGDWSAAADILAWPVHAALVAAVHSASGMNLELSGHVVNLLAYLLLIYAFLGVVRELGGGTRVVIAAGVLLLLHPQLNRDVTDFYRDQGYWALYVLAILLFVRFWQRPGWGLALGWSAAAMAATLFRVEGIAILALLPLSLLLRRDEPWAARLKRAAMASALFAAALLAGGLFWLAAPGGEASVSGRLAEIPQWPGRTAVAIGQDMSERAARLAEALLPRHADHHAMGATWTVLAYIVIATVLRTANWLYLALAAAAIALALPRPGRTFTPILGALAVINALALIVFATQELYLSYRYAMGLAFVVMLLAPFGLVALFESFTARRETSRRARWGFPLAAIALLVVGGAGLIRTGTTKTHEVEAGEWIRANVPAEASVYFDSMRARYYSGRDYEHRFDQPWERAHRLLSGRGWRRFDWIVLTIGDSELEHLASAQSLLGCEPAATFVNNRGDRAVIFDTSRCTGREGGSPPRRRRDKPE